MTDEVLKTLARALLADLRKGGEATCSNYTDISR